MLPRLFILALLCTAILAGLALAGWPQIIAASVVLSVIAFILGGVLRVLFLGFHSSTRWLAGIVVVAIIFSIVGASLIAFLMHPKHPEQLEQAKTALTNHIVPYLPPTPLIVFCGGLALIAASPGFGRVGCPLLAILGAVMLFIIGPTSIRLIVESFRSASEETRAYYMAYGFGIFVLLLTIHLASTYYGGRSWTHSITSHSDPQSFTHPQQYPSHHEDPWT